MESLLSNSIKAFNLAKEHDDLGFQISDEKAQVKTRENALQGATDFYKGSGGDSTLYGLLDAATRKVNDQITQVNNDVSTYTGQTNDLTNAKNAMVNSGPKGVCINMQKVNLPI
jgi:hypothetical protein